MFLPAYGQPLYYIFAFIDENGIIGCCCNDISKEKATPGYFHPIFPTFASKFNFWPFLTICTCSRAPPLIQPLLLLTKLLSLGAVAMISKEREQLHAITTPFSRQLPENFYFWSFLAIFHHLCLLMGDPFIPPPFLLTKMLSLGVVAMISTDRSHVRLLSPHLPAIFVKIPFFDHFHHF